MSRNGIWQLKKITLTCCKHGGSSRGLREMIETKLPQYQKINPRIEFFIEHRNGKHPFVKGEYVNGLNKVLCVANEPPEDIEKRMDYLKNQWGTFSKTLRTRVYTNTKSVQGPWNPFTVV